MPAVSVPIQHFGGGGLGYKTNRKIFRFVFSLCRVLVTNRCAYRHIRQLRRDHGPLGFVQVALGRPSARARVAGGVGKFADPSC
jgi:hypothetical protein